MGRYGSKEKLKSKYNYNMSAPSIKEIIPTDIYPFDLIVGGGLAKGDLLEIASPSGCGKSTLAVHIAASFLKKGYKVCYCDVEKGVDESMFERLGVKSQVGYELGADLLFTCPSTYTELDALFSDLLYSEGTEYSLIIVDSITAVIPDIAIDEPLGVAQIGIESRFQARFLQKIKPIARARGITIILINQLRMKIDIEKKRAKEESAGGFAIRFYPDIRLKMTLKEILRRKEISPEGVTEIPYGASVRLWSEKNRRVRPMIALPMYLIFGTGVSSSLFFFNLFLSNSLIERRGAYFRLDRLFSDKNFRQNELISELRLNNDKVVELAKEKGLLELVKPVEDSR